MYACIGRILEMSGHLSNQLKLKMQESLNNIIFNQTIGDLLKKYHPMRSESS
jgi:hypothetical protein